MKYYPQNHSNFIPIILIAILALASIGCGEKQKTKNGEENSEHESKTPPSLKEKVASGVYQLGELKLQFESDLKIRITQAGDATFGFWAVKNDEVKIYLPDAGWLMAKITDEQNLKVIAFEEEGVRKEAFEQAVLKRIN